jgi:tetratricopeptide (TPR) repeat protein
LPPDLRLRGWDTAGDLASSRGEFPLAVRFYEAALAISRALADNRTTQSVLHGLSSALFMSGDKQRAHALAQERQILCQDLGEEMISDARGGVAFTLMGLGDNTLWVALLEERLILCRQSGDRHGIAGALHFLGMAYSRPGDWSKARAFFEESMDINRELGGPDDLRLSQIHLAHVALAEGLADEAETLLTESLTVCRRRGEKRLVVECLHGLAEAAEAQGEWKRSAQLFGAAQALQEAIGFAFWRGYDDHFEALRRELGTAALTAAWKSGRAIAWQEAVDFALRQ